MKTQRWLPIAVIALLAACPATAQTVYKSVDAQGRVTYSSTPPPAETGELVERVPIEPGPTEQQQQEATQKAKELEATTNSALQQRQAQGDQRASTASVAEKELRKAQIALEEAQIKGDGDWQTLATGGRVLKQSYLDRVQSAEQRVREAENSVRNARSGRR